MPDWGTFPNDILLFCLNLAGVSLILTNGDNYATNLLQHKYIILLAKLL